MTSEQPTAIIRQTCRYIDAVQESLSIELKYGEPICVIDNVSKESLSELHNQLAEALSTSDEVRLEISKSTAASLQSVAFGLVPDLEECIKIGFLMGDRVVIWDYLGRLSPAYLGDKSNWEEIAVAANTIVSLRSLAENGRVAVLPHPLAWDEGARTVVGELATHGDLTGDAVSLATTMAVAGDLRVQPYTVVQDDRMYQHLIETATNIEPKTVDYESMMLSFLTRRLLTDRRFDVFNNAPLHMWAEIISENKEFYHWLRDELPGSSSQTSDYDLEIFADKLDRHLQSRNARVRSLSSEWALWGSSFGGVVSLASAVTTGSGAGAIAGGALSLSAALAAILGREKESPSVLAVFRKLKRSAEEHREAFYSAICDENDPADFACDYLTDMPREVSLDVAANVDDWTAWRLLNNPGDYAHAYSEVLYDLDESLFWRQIMSAFQEGMYDGCFPVNCYIGGDLIEEMPIEVAGTILEYIEQAVIGLDEKRERDLSAGFLEEFFVGLAGRTDARELIKRWYTGLEPASKRIWFESRSKKIFGELPPWLEGKDHSSSEA